MNQSLKLFLDLEVKPMKDVILHHPQWFVRCGNITMEQMETLREIKKQQEKEKEYIEEWNRTHDGSTVIDGIQYQYIEAIPKRLSLKQASDNFDSLNLQDTLWKDDETSMTWWERIEASYD